MTKLGSRKFLIAISLCVLSTVELHLDNISDMVWAGLIGGVVSTYLGVNVWQKKNGGSIPPAA